MTRENSCRWGAPAERVRQVKGVAFETEVFVAQPVGKARQKVLPWRATTCVLTVGQGNKRAVG